MNYLLTRFFTVVFSALFVISAFAGEGQKLSIVEIALNAPNLKTLVAAVKAADLVDTLSSKGPFTVFAPTDDAFAKLPAGTIEFLLENPAKLTEILTYHVIDGKRLPKSLVSEKFPKTLLGKEVEIKGTTRKVISVNNSLVITSPIFASNGIIYVIDSVLIP